MSVKKYLILSFLFFCACSNSNELVLTYCHDFGHSVDLKFNQNKSNVGYYCSLYTNGNVLYWGKYDVRKAGYQYVFFDNLKNNLKYLEYYDVKKHGVNISFHENSRVNEYSIYNYGVKVYSEIYAQDGLLIEKIGEILNVNPLIIFSDILKDTVQVNNLNLILLEKSYKELSENNLYITGKEVPIPQHVLPYIQNDIDIESLKGLIDKGSK